MAILPVNTVKLDGLNSNEINFTSRNKHKENPVPKTRENANNNLAKVPVMLMIAMTPSMLNAKTPIQYVPISNENISELVAQPHIEENDATYVASPDEFQNSYPLGVAYFSRLKIQQIKSALANGSKATIVLTTHKSDKYANGVEDVYLIKNSYTNSNKYQEPARIRELIYHNIGKDKEFLGVLEYEEIYKEGQASPVGFLTREYRLDDESAQFLLDLNAGSTKWLDKTGIEFKETTSPNIQSVKSYKY